MERQKMNFMITLAIIGLILVGSMASAVSGKQTDEEKIVPAAALKEKEIKNVIVMVPDGCDQDIQTLARWYLAEEGGELQLDSMVTGMVMTYMADSVITDSASAATAFSSGYKTSNGFIGVGPDADTLLSTVDSSTVADPYVPLATVLEGAKLEGKATGLVATSRITHATPAAYAAHIESRNMENEIMEHIVYQDIDVVFGGGERHLIPTTEGGSRTDGENLREVLLDEGYQYVASASEMEALTSGKTWGMFASSHMNPDMSRDDEEPSIANMTAKAIELLSQDEDGFFLMVEGSQVDWAGHDNDPVYMVTDFLAFDEAVEVAVNFAEEDGNTLVIAFPDHNTGGMTIGNDDTSYTDLTVEELVNPLKGEEGTVEIGWTTGGHTGGDVPLWSYGPYKMSGLVDNTEIPVHIAKKSGYKLADVAGELFVDVEEAFSGMWTVDTTDAANPVLVITANGKVAELPVSKDKMTIGGETYDLEGVVVSAPQADNGNGMYFIPQDAVDIINS